MDVFQLIFAFASLVPIPVVIASSAAGLQICASTSKFKSISQSWRKRKKKLDKKALLIKTKLNTIKVLISKASIDSYINYNEFQ